MIFVITGMDVFPFDRLAMAVDELQASGAAGDDFFVQLGSCKYEPRHARFERFLSFGEVCENIRRANVVITHAGAGSTLVCIQLGKLPIMVPRRARFGEIVDDHQVPFATRLSDGGVGLAVDDVGRLSDAIATARGQAVPSDVMGRSSELCAYLDGLWRSLPVKHAG